MTNDRQALLARLSELKAEHEAAVGEGPGEAPGFIQDEQATRKSYKLVRRDALESGVISEADLEAEGLPECLD